jgi:hypothetical protein
VTLAACSASENKEIVDVTKGSGGSPQGSGGAGGEGGADVVASVGGFNPMGSGGAGGDMKPCDPGTKTDDVDQDGFTEDEGDCNDCDPNVGPNAIEVIAGPNEEVFDEDCDGEKDEVEVLGECDQGIAVDEKDPMVALKAVGLCKVSKGEGDWGLVSAQWVLPDGTPPPSFAEQQFHLGHGVLGGFGPNVTVREGERMLSLSSGAARQPNDPGYQDVGGFDKGFTSGHPVGFPKESPACPGSITGQPHDGAAIELTLRTPQNAHGIAFDFDFYTYEWPHFVCSTYNDFFVALLSPFPPMQTDGNISFDPQGNPVSVNNAFLEVCGCLGNPPAPCATGGKTFTCALGDAELIGTGFGFDSAGEDHGATSWLTSQAPVKPSGAQDSVITIRWGAYDSGDGILDSTAHVDAFRWILKPGVSVKTVPVPQ